MLYIGVILTCLTVIEFANLVIRGSLIRALLVMKLIPEPDPELTEEMRARIYA